MQYNGISKKKEKKKENRIRRYIFLFINRKEKYNQLIILHQIKNEEKLF
jgi:hypothetical protein